MMRPDSDIVLTALAEQRLALRRQLQQQREQIVQRMTLMRESDSTFPRSMTMRFLLRRPALVTRLLAELAALVLGVRLLKAVTAALLMASILLTARARYSVPALPPPAPDHAPDRE